MTQSSEPQSHDSSPDHANDAENALPFGERSPGERDIPPTPPKHDDSNNHSHQRSKWWDKHFVIQVLIFGVGCYVAWVYRGQLVQMVESNKINRESLQSVQRAYVIFNGISGGVNLSAPNDPKKRIALVLLINWYNSGNTPAKKAITIGNFQSWRGELPENYDFHDILKLDKKTQSSELVLGPHQGSPAQLVVQIDNFRAQRAGTDRMYFYGWIVYKDVFSKDPDRLTEFCTEMIQVAVADAQKDISDMSNNFTWNTQPCPQHNCYDEDCADYASKIKEARTPIL